MKAKWFFAIVLSLFAADSANHAKANETVTIGDLGLISDAPFYIAIAEGYFEQAGITAKLERYTSAAQAMAQVATGEIKVVGGGVNPALFNAFARGFSVKIVAARTREVEGRTISSLMIRSDLTDAIKDYGHLKGRKVALNAAGSPHVFILGRMAERGGLALKDIDIAYMPFPDMRTAFLTKAVDAAIVSEPFVAEYERQGFAVAWRHTPDIIKDPPMELAVVFYNSDWAAKNLALANNFMSAYLKGARDFEAAAKGGGTRTRVVEILAKYTNVKDVSMYDKMQWPYADPNGRVAPESITEQQEWYLKNGQVRTRINVADMIDARFVENALRTMPAQSKDK